MPPPHVGAHLPGKCQKGLNNVRICWTLSIQEPPNPPHSGQTNRPINHHHNMTDRQTDIVLYRATIAAKKLSSQRLYSSYSTKNPPAHLTHPPVIKLGISASCSKSDDIINAWAPPDQSVFWTNVYYTIWMHFFIIYKIFHPREIQYNPQAFKNVIFLFFFSSSLIWYDVICFGGSWRLDCFAL